jgi:hypothetical protein
MITAVTALAIWFIASIVVGIGVAIFIAGVGRR